MRDDRRDLQVVHAAAVRRHLRREAHGRAAVFDHEEPVPGRLHAVEDRVAEIGRRGLEIGEERM